MFIPNGVSAADSESADLIKQKFNLDRDGYILYLGRLVPEKGIRYLIDAYKNINTSKKLVIAGGSSDTAEFEAELKNSAQGNGNIIFTGFVQGKILSELYSNAYLYVLPSDLEGMPLSLLEAMSYSNCCLTSDIAECADVIGDVGVTFRKGDADDLREKLQFLCDNPTVVASYKEKSSDYICERYKWDDVVQKTLQIYKAK